MARARNPQPEPKPPAGFIASAVRLPTASRNMAGRTEGWQTQAWEYYDAVGELRYVANWVGNVMGRATLKAARREGDALVPVEDGPAAEAMRALYGGPQGQSEMLAAIGVNFTVAGEGYLVNRARDDQWAFLSTGKVTEVAGKLRADFGTEAGMQQLARDDLVIRMWTPHPRDPSRADSPVRSNLSVLGQITGYDAHITAQIRSRLTGAGVWFISNEIDFPKPPDADPNATPAQLFLNMLTEAMLTPIENPADPSALVPIVAMVPPEALGNSEHVKFWTELDDKVIAMREAGIKRLSLGMDAPPEVLLGLANENHWNAWLSEESAIKAHLEPKLSTVAGGITAKYLRPAIRDQVDDLDDWFTIVDTSSIRLRPNRSREAIELYDKGELSGPALRRETGFQPGDKPDEEEAINWLLRKVATGSTDPSQTEAALALLGARLNTNTAPARVNKKPPDDMRTDTQPDLPRRDIPTLAASANEGLMAACNVLVYRALERAGNRLRNLHPRTDTSMMAAVDVYRELAGDPDKLLAGAWECAPDVLEPYTDEAVDIVDTLDFYTKGLLASRRPHSEAVLRALLDSRPRGVAAEV